ncbi:MAG: LCP family protein [Promicromonosporaceae bacterium]|nr:LCP family protein [Promicromonosporaceae bacterium]
MTEIARRAMAHRRAPSVRRTRVRRIVVITASVLACVLALGGGYVAYAYLHFTTSVHKVEGALPAAKHTAGPKGQAAPKGVAQNILLIGDDQRPQGMTAAQYQELSTTPDGGSLNTDTMIVLHVVADGSSATMVSFPRDSYVTIPGYGKDKLNAAFALGYEHASGTQDQKDAAGVNLLATTIQNLTGLQIDHYVKVSLLSFYNIAKSLGPVQVCLKNPVHDHFSGINLPAGVSELNATQALQFVRQRHGLPNGDFDRVVRQQYFLSVEAQQILSAGTLLNPVKLNNVIGAIGGSLETDAGLNMLNLAMQLKGLRGSGIHSATIPLGNPSTSMVPLHGVQSSVDNIDTAALPDFFDTVNGEPTTAQRVAAAKPAAPGSVTVDVLNGAGTAHGSSDALATFKSLGFQTGQPADAVMTKTTTIYVPNGQEAQAKAVLQYLPGATIATTAQYTTVTVVLGTDGKMPSATPPAAPPAATAPATTAPPASTPAATPAAPPASTPAATPAPSAPPGTSNYSTATCIN